MSSDDGLLEVHVEVHVEESYEAVVVMVGATMLEDRDLEDLGRVKDCVGLRRNPGMSAASGEAGADSAGKGIVALGGDGELELGDWVPNLMVGG